MVLVLFIYMYSLLCCVDVFGIALVLFIYMYSLLCLLLFLVLF